MSNCLQSLLSIRQRHKCTNSTRYSISYHDLLTVLSKHTWWKSSKDPQASLRFLEDIIKIIKEDPCLVAEGSLLIFTIIVKNYSCQYPQRCSFQDIQGSSKILLKDLGKIQFLLNSFNINVIIISSGISQLLWQRVWSCSWFIERRFFEHCSAHKGGLWGKCCFGW